MFKNSPSICYIFFATDDVIVTSVNTYMSMMGISTEHKYLIKSQRENKQYGAKRLFKLFPTINWSLDGLKALIKKTDNTGSVWTMRGRPLPNMANNSTSIVNFSDQRFQSTKTPVFVSKHLSNGFSPYFLFSGKDLIKYLSSVLIRIIYV